MLKMSTHTIRGMLPKTIYIHVSLDLEQHGKALQTIGAMATNIWQNLPSVLKELNTFTLKKIRQKVSASKPV